MTAATTSSEDLVLPGDGYDEFVDFLRAPSQPQLLEMKRGDIIDAFHKQYPTKRIYHSKPYTPSTATPSSSLNGARSSKQPGPKKEAKKDTGFGNASAAKRPAAAVRKSSLVVDDEETWQRQYEALKSYHAEHGSCSVPFGKETGALRSWTERQKKLHARSMLEDDRVDDLKALGFDFAMKQPLSARSVNVSGADKSRGKSSTKN